MATIYLFNESSGIEVYPKRKALRVLIAAYFNSIKSAPLCYERRWNVYTTHKKQRTLGFSDTGILKRSLVPRLGRTC
jgi:hypothetical protein